MVKRATHWIARLWSDRRGVTAIMTALGAVMLIGFAGLAIDVVTWELAQHKMQSAADAAALAGAIADSWGQNVTAAADAVAQGYGYPNSAVSVGTTASNAVQVKISQAQPQYFTRLFLPTPPTVSAQAAAYPPGIPTGTLCLLALADAGQLEVGSVNFSGTTDVVLDHCDLYNDADVSNSTNFTGTSYLSVRDIFLSGGFSQTNNANVCTNNSNPCAQPFSIATYVPATPNPYADLSVSASGTAPEVTVSISDPYTSASTSSTSTSTPPPISLSKTGCDPTPTSTATLSPAAGSGGVYIICGGLDIASQTTVTLDPGIYVIVDGNLTVHGGATLTTVNGGAPGANNGATIILASTNPSNSYSITFNGNSTETLSAPESTTDAGLPGIAIWDSNDSSQPGFATDIFDGTSGMVINGVIYLPAQQFSYAGNNTADQNNAIQCSQLVAWTAQFTGNAYFTHQYCSALSMPVQDPTKPPVLAD